MPSVLKMIKALPRALGFDVVRYPYRIAKAPENPLEVNRIKLLKHQGVDLVLDVGASRGQFGRELRKDGYAGKIISFEPLKAEFATLSLHAANDPNWEVYNFALGDVESTADINIAGNSYSSSLLEMQSKHEESAPQSKYIGKETIQVKRLDDLASVYSGYKSIYLKLDVQGYEKNVLDGFRDNLHRIIGLQTEMSLVELYKGEYTFFEYSEILRKHGFKLMSIEPGFYDNASGQLLQLDGVWYR